MPLAVAPPTIEDVNWDWLSGQPGLLFGFIMLVLAVPTTIGGNWQLVRSGVRRLRPKPAQSPLHPRVRLRRGGLS